MQSTQDHARPLVLGGPLQFHPGRSSDFRITLTPRLPVTKYSGVMRSSSPITAAGPSRIHTGFPFMPVSGHQLAFFTITSMQFCCQLKRSSFRHSLPACLLNRRGAPDISGITTIFRTKIRIEPPQVFFNGLEGFLKYSLPPGTLRNMPAMYQGLES